MFVPPISSFSANANSRVAENDAVAPDSAKGRSQVNRVVMRLNDSVTRQIHS